MAQDPMPRLHPSGFPVGARVGTWRIVNWQGRGSYGAVYRASEIGREMAGPVALKIAMHPEDPRFTREVALLSRLRHPNVPVLQAHGKWADTEGTYPYLVMQWIDGTRLYDWAAVRNPSSRQLMRLLAQVARALAATHAVGGVHRDVKGDNVLVRVDGHAFLVDFGSSTHTGASLLTFEPLAPGTPTYRSPEAWRYMLEQGRRRDAHYEALPSDDVFALGMAAYRLVTDEHPPPTNPSNTESRLWYVDKQPPRPPMALNPRVYPRLSALILRMLSLRPEARGAAGELAELLEQYAKNAGPDADQPLFAWETLERSAWSRDETFAAFDLGHRPRHRDLQVVRATQKRDAAVQPEKDDEFRLWLVVATAALLLLCLVGAVGHWIHKKWPTVAHVEQEDAGTSDGGVSELGQEALTSYVRHDPIAEGRSSISVDVPPDPLPGQRRTNGRGQCLGRGEVPINGGCWYPFDETVGPPCASGQYEWLGRCYQPSFVNGRQPTSEPWPPDSDAR